MKKVLLAVLFLVPVYTNAALPPDSSTSSSARVCYTGNATTYNPTKAGGWKTGGMGLAAGGTYNPDGYHAALLLEYAQRETCGFKKTCYAAVSAPNGKALIVLINDNGPMCADPATYAKAPDCRSGGIRARVIDFNERSMRYMSGGASGSNSGLIQNVKVCLLNGTNHVLGPVDSTERQEWAKKIFSTPSTHFANVPPSSPTSPTSPTSPFSSLYGGNQGPPPPPAYTQQQAATQPGQYFNNAYAPVPANQPFPVNSKTPIASGTQGSGTSLGQSLLDLIKPITTGVQSTKPTVTIMHGTTSVGTISTPQSGTQVTITPLTMNPAHSPSQTFVQNYLEYPRPSQMSETNTLGLMLESLKVALNRILEILRLR